MKSKYVYNINSYKELKKAKQDLKLEIEDQVDTIKNSNLVKWTSVFYKKESFSDSLSQSLNSIDFWEILTGPISNLIGSYLMRYKSTRKFFIVFFIAKEMIPYLLSKINELFEQKDSVQNR